MTEVYLKVTDQTPSGDWTNIAAWPGPGFYRWGGALYVVGDGTSGVYSIGMPMGLDWQSHLTDQAPIQPPGAVPVNLRDLSILIAVAQQPDLAPQLLTLPNPDLAEGDATWS